MLKKSDALDAAIAQRETKASASPRSRSRKASKENVMRTVKETATGFDHDSLHPDIVAMAGGEAIRMSLELEGITEANVDTDTEEDEDGKAGKGGLRRRKVSAPAISPRLSMDAPQQSGKPTSGLSQRDPSHGQSMFLLHDIDSHIEAVDRGSWDNRQALQTGKLSTGKAGRRYSDTFARMGSADLDQDLDSRLSLSSNYLGEGESSRLKKKGSKRGSKRSGLEKKAVSFGPADGAADEALGRKKSKPPPPPKRKPDGTYEHPPKRPDGSTLIEISGKQFLVDKDGVVTPYIDGAPAPAPTPEEGTGDSPAAAAEDDSARTRAARADSGLAQQMQQWDSARKKRNFNGSGWDSDSSDGSDGCRTKYTTNLYISKRDVPNDPLLDEPDSPSPSPSATVSRRASTPLIEAEDGGTGTTIEISGKKYHVDIDGTVTEVTEAELATANQPPEENLLAPAEPEHTVLEISGKTYYVDKDGNVVDPNSTGGAAKLPSTIEPPTNAPPQQPPNMPQVELEHEGTMYETADGETYTTEKEKEAAAKERAKGRWSKLAHHTLGRAGTPRRRPRTRPFGSGTSPSLRSSTSSLDEEMAPIVPPLDMAEQAKSSLIGEDDDEGEGEGGGGGQFASGTPGLGAVALELEPESGQEEKAAARTAEEEAAYRLQQLETAELELFTLQVQLLEVVAEKESIAKKLEDLLLPAMFQLDGETDLWARTFAAESHQLEAKQHDKEVEAVGVGAAGEGLYSAQTPVAGEGGFGYASRRLPDENERSGNATPGGGGGVGGEPQDRPSYPQPSGPVKFEAARREPLAERARSSDVLATLLAVQHGKPREQRNAMRRLSASADLLEDGRRFLEALEPPPSPSPKKTEAVAKPGRKASIHTPWEHLHDEPVTPKAGSSTVTKGRGGASSDADGEQESGRSGDGRVRRASFFGAKPPPPPAPPPLPGSEASNTARSRVVVETALRDVIELAFERVITTPGTNANVPYWKTVVCQATNEWCVGLSSSCHTTEKPLGGGLHQDVSPAKITNSARKKGKGKGQRSRSRSSSREPSQRGSGGKGGDADVDGRRDGGRSENWEVASNGSYDSHEAHEVRLDGFMKSLSQSPIKPPSKARKSGGAGASGAKRPGSRGEGASRGTLQAVPAARSSRSRTAGRRTLHL